MPHDPLDGPADRPGFGHYSPWAGARPPSRPQPPATAYYLWRDAEEAVEYGHGFHPISATALAVRFVHPEDKRVITVWTCRPSCLVREMRDRDCECLGLSWLGDHVGRLRAPRDISLLPWHDDRTNP